jgi:hypothetical protein
LSHASSDFCAMLLLLGQANQSKGLSVCRPLQLGGFHLLPLRGNSRYWCDFLAEVCTRTGTLWVYVCPLVAVLWRLPRLALASASRIEAVLQGSTMSGLPMVGVCAAPVLAHAQAPSSPPPRRACTEVGRSDEMIHSPYTPSSRSTPPPPAAARHTRGGVTWTAWF